MTIPWDVKTDAKAIYSRWAEGDFDCNLLCDIRLQKRVSARSGLGTHASQSIVMKDYDGESRATTKARGNSIMANAGLIASALSEIGLVEKSRPEFTEINKKGCLAVVLANKDYRDVNRGDTVFYCSTEGRLVGGGVEDTKKLSEPSKGAKLLLKALKLETKIRAIRSSTLPKANKYRPTEGP
jgi:hypothetical protein